MGIHSISSYDQPIRVLNTLRSKWYPDAIIAGGAVRDIYFDILPRDFDIFIQHPRSKTPEGTNPTTKSFLKNLLHLDFDFGDSIYQSYGYDDPDDTLSFDRVGEVSSYVIPNKIVQIFDIMKNLVPYQIIFVETSPLDYVDKMFDVDLCKAYCDGTRYRFTHEFLQDARNKTLTVSGEIKTPEFMDFILDNHVAKLKHKFPQHTIKIAEHNKHLVDTSKHPHLL